MNAKTCLVAAAICAAASPATPAESAFCQMGLEQVMEATALSDEEFLFYADTYRDCPEVLAYLLSVAIPKPDMPDVPDLNEAPEEFVAAHYQPEVLARIQAGLTLEGYYERMLDGEWGEGSREALAALARRHGSPVAYVEHVDSLLSRLTDAEWRDGWTRLYFRRGAFSVVYPSSLLAESPGEEHLTFTLPDRDFLVRWIFKDRRGTVDMHDWARKNRNRIAEHYTNNTSEYWITAVTLEGEEALRLYLRSFPVSEGYVTLLVQAAPRYRSQAALVAASYQAPGFEGPVYDADVDYVTLEQAQRLGALPMQP